MSICFFCEDALAIYKEVTARGLVTDEPFVGNNLWVVSLRDPDGYKIAFESPTEVREETTYTVWIKRGDLNQHGGSRAEAEMLSEVSARSSRLAPLPLPDQSTPAIAAFTAGWPDWKRASLTVCPVSPDGAICEGLRYDPAVGLLFPRAER